MAASGSAARGGPSRSLSLDPGAGGRRSGGAGAGAGRPQGLGAPSVLLKLLQLVLSVACLACHGDAFVLIEHNTKAIQFPFIVFSAYTVITGVIVCGYAAGMKMRELLMRVFGSLGAVLFLISGCLTADVAVTFWQDWRGNWEEGNDGQNYAADSIPRRQGLFVAQIALSLATALLHAADVLYSFRRTLALLE